MKSEKSKLIALLESEMDALLEASKMSARGEYRQRANSESPERVSRAKGLRFCKFKDVKLNDGKQMVVRFETAGSNYDTDGSTYLNLVVIPGLTSAYKQNASYATIAESIRNSDVQVKCGCKDFTYRYEYWINQDKSLAKVGDEAETYAINNKPDETNPDNDQGPFCKHLIAVTSVFLANISSMAKSIRAMDLEAVVEPLQENDAREEGMIVLEKEESPAILGAPEEIDEKLAKDTGLTEAEREEVKEALTKDESPEEIEEEQIEDSDRDLSKEDIDAINEIEPELEEGEERLDQVVELKKDNGELELETSVELEKDDGIDVEEPEPELEKDKGSIDADEIL